jgi:uncharacterized protein DUF6950
MLMRKEGWEGLLALHVEVHARKPQKWGELDCSLFACDWVLSATGEDPAREFRGKYETMPGAYRLVKDYAGGLQGTAEKISFRMGMEETTWQFARRGDIGLVPGNGSPALGVVDTSGKNFAVHGKDGLDFIPLKNAIKIWRVG